MYKIRVERDFFKFATNSQSDKAFLLESNFDPKALSALAPELNTHEKTLKKYV